MIKRVIYSLLIILFISSLAGLLILYGRGYRFNFQQKSLTPTGILSATSTPDGASIWFDGKLISATNVSLSLKPNWYQLRISKEGYQSWEKRVRIQGEVVTRVEALLIPTNPSLRTLTVNGVSSPTLSSTGSKVAYIVPQNKATESSTLRPKTGIWVLELRSGTLGGNIAPKQVYQTSGNIDWSNASLIWSPDEKQIILKLSKMEKKKEVILFAYQIFIDGSNTPPLDITSSLPTLLSDWQNVRETKDNEMIESLPPSISQLFKTSASKINFSPDDSRILYLATASSTLAAVKIPPLIGSNTTQEARTIEKSKYYIYDIKEDKNFYLTDQKTINDAANLIWYTDSKHIIMIEKDSIYIVDYDGLNKRAIYSGPFSNNIVYPWTAPGKLVILTNLNKPLSLPNLYEIDLR